MKELEKWAEEKVRQDNEREKLIELCGDLMELPCCDTYEGMADHLIANGVTVQEWISVKDRLPNIDEQCLLCIENRITKYRWVAIGYFHTNYDEYVTHWMPLPEPPKEA